MSSKTLVWLCVGVGSIIGGYAPVLWGGSLFSFSSIFLSSVGGIIGIFVGIKIGNYIEE